MVIQSPPGWGWDQLRGAVNEIGSARPEEYWHEGAARARLPAVRRIGIADIRDALARGIDDFEANRTDVVFLCVIYPVLGLILGRLASGYGLLPLIFPLASGFALVGPFAAIGLNEMSRRRAQGSNVSWLDAFNVLRSPSIGPIMLLGLLLIALFLLWLVVAQVIYVFTLGPEPPPSVAAFLSEVFTTGAGWAMIASASVSDFCSPHWCWRSASCRFPCCSTAMSGLARRSRHRCEPWRPTRASWRYGD